MREIFKQPFRRRRSARIEFDAFRSSCIAEIHSACAKTPGFKELSAGYGFDVLVYSNTVQAGFSARPMGMEDVEGNSAFERHATIVYSFVPTGDVLVTIYPFRSQIAEAEEGHIIIGLGHLSAYQLRQRINSDIKAMVAYAYVSSILAESTWRQRWKVWRLRKTKPRSIEGKFVAGGTSLLVGTSAKAAVRAAFLATFTALVKPAGFIAVGYLAGRFGFETLISYLPK